MRAKAGSAALALLAVVLLTPLSGLAAAPQGGETHPALPAHIVPITAEAFEEMLASAVEGQGGVEIEQGDTLRVELHDQAKVLFFTRPGHRAHPGIVEVKIVEEGGVHSIDTSGWWAGDDQAFAFWFRVFERRNERLSREWQEE